MLIICNIYNKILLYTIIRNLLEKINIYPILNNAVLLIVIILRRNKNGTISPYSSS